MLIPMWNPHIAPIKLIIYIKKAPRNEFKTSFNIVFIGTINNFPKINQKKIHDVNAIILLKSKFIFITCPI